MKMELVTAEECEKIQDLHWVGSPEDQSETSNGSEKASKLVTLGHGLSTTVDGQVPDDNQVSDACNGIVAPLLRSTFGAESSKKTSQDHNEVSSEGHQDVATVESSNEAEIKKEKRSGQAPVDVTCPVNLAVDVLGGVRDVLVGGSHGNDVV